MFYIIIYFIVLILFVQINIKKFHLMNSLFFIIITINIFIPYIFIQTDLMNESAVTLFTNEGGQEYTNEFILYFLFILIGQTLLLYFLNKRFRGENFLKSKVNKPTTNTQTLKLKAETYLKISIVVYFIVFISILDTLGIIHVYKTLYYLGALLSGIIFIKNRFSILNPAFFVLAILSENATRSAIFPYLIFFMSKYFISSSLSKREIIFLFFLSIYLMVYIMGLRSGEVISIINIIFDTNIIDIFIVILQTSTFYKMTNEAFFFHDIYNTMCAEGLKYYYYGILPLPSKYLSFNFNQYSVGVMNGIDISTLGMPMPAFLEFYFYFGWPSLLIYFGIIYLFIKFDFTILKFKTFSKVRKVFYTILTIFLLYALIMSGHSSFRAAFRMLDILFVVYFLYILLVKVFPKRRKDD